MLKEVDWMGYWITFNLFIIMPSFMYFLIEFEDINNAWKTWIHRVIAIEEDAEQAIELVKEKTNYPLRAEFNLRKIEHIDLTVTLAWCIIRK